MGYDLKAIMKMSSSMETPATAEEQLLQLSPYGLQDFPAELHRFKPAAAPRMEELKASIRQNGILNPLIVRQLPSGEYQILTGHNRRQAAIQLGLATVPCRLMDVPNDDDATSIMIADNLNNRTLFLSEKGWAYRQLMEIYSHQGARGDLTSSQNGTKLPEDLTSSQNGAKLRADETIAHGFGESRNKVQRYIRLTYLIAPLLDLVDQKKIGVGVGVQLSYLSAASQETVYLYCYAADPMHPLKESHVKALREVEEDPDSVVDIDLLEELTAKPTNSRLRTLKIEMASLRQYFPSGTAEEVVRQTIQAALAEYFDTAKDSLPSE